MISTEISAQMHPYVSAYLVVDVVLVGGGCTRSNLFIQWSFCR